MAKGTPSAPKGVGLDIGTMNLVSARRTSKGVETKRMRDVFLDFPITARKRLLLAKTSFVEREDEVLVLGDAALEIANVFGREARRPLSAGLISPQEADSLDVLGLLVKEVLGEPRVENEVCYFSVPAQPIDQPDRDVIYHRGVFERIVEECGYDPYPSNEGMAIIFSECAKEDFSGVSMSFGSGMTNVALAINTIEGLSFSVARCLADDFLVCTDQGPRTVREIKAGDKVIGAHGDLVSVAEVVNNGPRNSLVKVSLEGLPAFPQRVTSDHRVLVKQGLSWSWKEAADLQKGDVVGTPVVKPARSSNSSYYFGRANGKNITVAGARNLGRFFGVFLGDGSCGPHAEDPRFVQLAFNRKDGQLVDKYCSVLTTLFGRTPQVVDDPAENVTRVKLHMTSVAQHMRERFYDSEGTKVFPLGLDKISNTMAVGILEGLLDSDGYEGRKQYALYNTSLPVVVLAHHLLVRLGVHHTILKRPPRTGGVNPNGVLIVGTKDSYTVRVGGHVHKAMLETLFSVEGNCVEQMLGGLPDFGLFRVGGVEEVPYKGDVYDLVVDSSHRSFASVGMVVHNSGDWIDKGAAMSVGSTQARICAIKEQGIDLAKPEDREQEAVVLYYRALIDYVLDEVAKRFKAIQGQFALPKPIPLVVSGGTSLAGGFMGLFEKVFAKKRFPIEVSEIRQAGEPLNAVAYGMLVQAVQEYEE